MRLRLSMAEIGADNVDTGLLVLLVDRFYRVFDAQWGDSSWLQATIKEAAAGIAIRARADGALLPWTMKNSAPLRARAARPLMRRELRTSSTLKKPGKLAGPRMRKARRTSLIPSRLVKPGAK